MGVTTENTLYNIEADRQTTHSNILTEKIVAIGITLYNIQGLILQRNAFVLFLRLVINYFLKCFTNHPAASSATFSSVPGSSKR